MAHMIYTLDNIHTVQDIISDLAKDLYGTRSACPRTPEAQVAFMNSYNARIEEVLEEEHEELRRHSIRDGVEYTSWSHYYDVLEAKLEAAQLPEPIEELPFQPADHKMVGAIEQWAYGG